MRHVRLEGIQDDRDGRAARRRRQGPGPHPGERGGAVGPGADAEPESQHAVGHDRDERDGLVARACGGPGLDAEPGPEGPVRVRLDGEDAPVGVREALAARRVVAGWRGGRRRRRPGGGDHATGSTGRQVRARRLPGAAGIAPRLEDGEDDDRRDDGGADQEPAIAGARHDELRLGRPAAFRRLRPTHRIRHVCLASAATPRLRSRRGRPCARPRWPPGWPRCRPGSPGRSAARTRGGPPRAPGARSARRAARWCRWR